MSDFAPRVLAWFDAHGRHDLPWQRDITPYRVWVSEIMLQQTQVATVIEYFERFTASFPDVVALAAAERDAVLAHWSGLGYYARARNLHKAAEAIVAQHDGRFPLEFEALLALPGVGRSTAAAILAIADGQRHAILDGNVKRVLARHAAVPGWPGKAAVADALWSLAEACTPAARVGDYTQAIMDLGATLCTRTQPDCAACPVRSDCRALADDAVGEYPGRKPRREKPLKQTTMVLASMGNAVLLERRPEAGIWGGLWSLPEAADGAVEDWVAERLAMPIAASEDWAPLRHSFSHYDLDIRPVLVRLPPGAGRVADGGGETWFDLDAPPPGGIAAPVARLIDELRKHVTND